MLSLSRNHVIDLVNSCNDEIEKGNVSIITMESYLENFLKTMSMKNEVTYPRTIKVPRDIDYMLRTGDISPELEFTLDEPFMYNGNPIWTRDPAKGIGLGFGYMNGNKRYLSEMYLGDNSNVSGPHMVIGGMSGGGKSVCVNNLIFNMLMSYSPFDLNLYLIDAKISEAKRYATTHRVPHVKVIGATSDTAYVISVLEVIDAHMTKLNKLFGSFGCNNIADFRETTGLSIPRIVVFVDEYQLQFQGATTREKEALTNLYDKVCTAGRSAGLHLVLCSQSYLQELKKALFHNMPLRACLKCVKETSEGIIENSVAAEGIPIGEIHVNLTGARSVEETTMFKVPFQSKKDFESEGIFLQKCGEEITQKYGHVFGMNFYDEDQLLKEENLNELLETYSQPNRLVVGSPAFVKSKEVDVAYFDQSFEDLENIGVFSPDGLDVREYISTMTSNFSRMNPNNTKCIYLVADQSLVKDLEPPKYAAVFDCDKADSPYFQGFMLNVYRKIVMLETDREIFRGQKVLNPEVEEALKEKFKNNSSVVTELNIARVSRYIEKLNTQNFGKILYRNSNLPNKKDLMIQAIATLEGLFSYSQEFINMQVTANNIPTHYFNIVGFDKIAGLTRGGKAIFNDPFKELLFDAYKAKCCIICYSTIASCFSPFKEVFGWVMVSNAGDSSNRLGIEVPKGVKPTLGYATKPATGYALKFKKLNKYERVV